MSSSLKKCCLILLVLRGLPVQKENIMNYLFEEMNEDIQGHESPNAFLQRILLHIRIPVAHLEINFLSSAEKTRRFFCGV